MRSVSKSRGWRDGEIAVPHPIDVGEEVRGRLVGCEMDRDEPVAAAAFVHDEKHVMG